MNSNLILRPEVVAGALLILLPMLVAAFSPAQFARIGRGWPRAARIALPATLCLPYALIANAFGTFHWKWLALYAVLPVAIAFLLDEARAADKRTRGNWRDFAILAALGLAVDLRWLEPAWPAWPCRAGQDAAAGCGDLWISAVRQLDGVGFDLRLKGATSALACGSFCFMR